jgi:hypothetical protein
MTSVPTSWESSPILTNTKKSILKKKPYDFPTASEDVKNIKGKQLQLRRRRKATATSNSSCSSSISPTPDSVVVLEKLRMWRKVACERSLYSTAERWGALAVSLSGNV